MGALGSLRDDLSAPREQDRVRAEVRIVLGRMGADANGQEVRAKLELVPLCFSLGTVSTVDKGRPEPRGFVLVKNALRLIEGGVESASQPALKA